MTQQDSETCQHILRTIPVILSVKQEAVNIDFKVNRLTRLEIKLEKNLFTILKKDTVQEKLKKY